MSNKNNGKKEVGILAAVVLGGLAVFVAVQLFLNSAQDGGFSKYVQTITKDEFYSKREKSESFVLIYGAESCSACASYKPVVASTIEDGYKDIPVYYIDGEALSNEDRNAVSSYLGVENTPTTYVFSKGVVIDSAEGVQKKDDLKAIFEEYKLNK